MDERKRKTLVFVMFVGAVIFGAVYFTGRSKDAVVDAGVGTTAVGTQMAMSNTVSDSAAGEKYHWQRDPFAYGKAALSVAGEGERSPQFQLTAISEANGKLMAIINGKPLMRGELIDGWTVAKLSRTGAILSLNGRELVLEIGN